MFFADNCKQYKYTKIVVPIFLENSPSDYDDMQYYWDVTCDDYSQENVYIGNNKISEIRLKRIKKADCECAHRAEWKLEMVIVGGKSEEETIRILNEFCRVISLKFICHYKFFQHCGFNGFSYDRLHMERKYAYEDKAFSDSALNMYCGSVEVKTISSIDNKVFMFPKTATMENENRDRLVSAFMGALKCKDKISRYILLYYLFEIMYETDEYQTLKEKYKSIYGKDRCKKDRSIILLQYLQQQFDLKKYSSLGKTVILDSDTLEIIIKARNDLTHRGDPSKLSNLMYSHLLPILQEVIRKL